jgi:uncharacterized membrane protein
MKRIAVTLLYIASFLVFGETPSFTLGCDPNEQCNKCIAHNPFGGCILYGNDPDCEIRKKICQTTKIQVPPSPTLPPPVDLNTCIRDPMHCPDTILKGNAIAIGQPIVQAYFNDLRAQANGRWKSLPDEFVAEFASFYPEIDFRRVRYAENINTRHGQSMTLCYEVFLAPAFNSNDRSSIALMLHELYHTVQCVNRGGIGPFVDEYIAHSIGTIVEKRSFNIHDDINLERDAEQRSQQLINAFGWPFVIQNDCAKDIQLFVLLQQTSGQWTTVGWWKLQPNKGAQLVSESRYLHSRSGTWYFYAEDTGGNYSWSGNHEVAFGGTTYKTVEKQRNVNSDNFSATLVCNNATQRSTQPRLEERREHHAPTEFTYRYPFQSGGPMRWVKTTGTLWREEGPDHAISFFEEIDRTTVDGTTGTRVRRVADTLEIFLPDLDSAGPQPRLLRQRHGGTNWQWVSLGEILSGK